MAATRVQTKLFTSVSYAITAAGAWASNTTTGNTIIVAVVYNSDTAGIISGIADSQSNTYSQIHTQISGDITCNLWYAYNITGGTTPTVTVTMSTGDHDIAVVMREYSGLTTTDPLDQKSEGTTASSTSHTSAATPTTTQGGELVVGALGFKKESVSFKSVGRRGL